MLRRLILAIPAALALLAPACTSDGHIALLGYTSQPNYDTSFKTVRIPMVKSRSTYVVTPVVGLEMDLHRAIIREVTQRTPYKVRHGDADTELNVKITRVGKALLNYTQENNIREGEYVIEVAVVWRDLRTGRVLTRPSRRPGQALPPEERQPLLIEEATSVLPPRARPIDVPAPPLNPATAVRPDEEPLIDPLTREPVIPVLVRASGNYRPELGESTTTALQRAMDQVAVQLVQSLETSGLARR